MIIVLIIIAVLAISLIAREKYKRRRTLSSLEALLGLFKNPFETLIKQAKERFFLEEYNRAIAITDQILEIQPKNNKALLLRALSLESINFNLEAIEDFELANSIKEIDANSIGLLGLTYKKIGEFEKGQEYLKLSIEKGSKTYEPNYIANKLASPIAIEMYKSKSKIPENLRRRTRDDFTKYLMESDKIDLIESVKKHIHNLESAMAFDPNDQEHKRLYELSKIKLNNFEQTGIAKADSSV